MTDNTPQPIDPISRMETRQFLAWHHSLYAFYHALFTLGFSLRMQGKHNMPTEGPALIVANHQSFLDPLIIGLVAQRPLVYLARKTLFKNRYFAAMIRSLNAVPIDQEGVGKEGIRAILEQLSRGRAVVVFPEGERTWDGKMLPLRPGIQLLIKRTKAPIIPIGIAGAFDAWPRVRAYPLPAPLAWSTSAGALSVSLGKPLDAHYFAELPRKECLTELFDKIHEEQVRAERLRRK
jgi:1-acyl-sn-glycerol-3-phosphate acyltransferase